MTIESGAGYRIRLISVPITTAPNGAVVSYGILFLILD